MSQIMPNLGKFIYSKIIYEFNTKNITVLLNLIQKYKKPVIDSIIRLTIINTQNFDYAIRLLDTTNSIEIHNILQNIFETKFKKLNYNELQKLYDKSILKKDVLNHELFKRFKHLFLKQLNEYKLICFYVFNNTLVKNLIGSSTFKKQSFIQFRYNLNTLNLNQNNIDLLLKLIIEDDVSLENISIHNNNITINHLNSNHKKTYDDIQLEALLLCKLRKLNLTKKTIINTYETCNINDITKNRTKLLIKLLCV